MIRRAALTSCATVRHSVSSVLATQVSRRSFFQAQQSDEMPLKGLADSIGDAFGVSFDAMKEEQRKFKLQPADSAVYVPSVPHIFPVARLASNNAFIRDVLVFDEAKRIKPRLSWYDPYDTTWVPSGWFTEGIRADMDYYFNPADQNNGNHQMKDAALKGSAEEMRR